MIWFRTSPHASEIVPASHQTSGAVHSTMLSTVFWNNYEKKSLQALGDEVPVAIAIHFSSRRYRDRAAQNRQDFAPHFYWHSICGYNLRIINSELRYMYIRHLYESIYLQISSSSKSSAPKGKRISGLTLLFSAFNIASLSSFKRIKTILSIRSVSVHST